MCRWAVAYSAGIRHQGNKFLESRQSSFLRHRDAFEIPQTSPRLRSRQRASVRSIEQRDPARSWIPYRVRVSIAGHRGHSHGFDRRLPVGARRRCKVSRHRRWMEISRCRAEAVMLATAASAAPVWLLRAAWLALSRWHLYVDLRRRAPHL